MSGLTSARIAARKEWTPDLITLTLDQNGGVFQAGQFFNLAIESEGKLVRRSYSAASAPEAPLEFFISRVSGGELTEKLFLLKEGDELKLDPTPLGFFTLAEVPDVRALWLASTGTGLGPYISMLRQGDVLSRFQKVVVAHGVRHPEHLAYSDELRDLCGRHAHLKYLPVVSGPDTLAPSAIPGRLTGALERGALEEAAGEPFQADSHLLLCGNPDMIKEMGELMKARGYQKHRRREPGHFNFEKYW